MLTAQQYRMKAAEFAGLAETAHSPSAAREFHRLARHWSSLAANKEWLAAPDGQSAPVFRHVDRDRGNEEQMLKCLGTAVIVRWNTLPKKIQRDLFEYASSLGELQETTAGQIACFLHYPPTRTSRARKTLNPRGIEQGRSLREALTK